jgi:hypothetical protein
MTNSRPNEKKRSAATMLSSIVAVLGIFTFLTGYQFAPDIFKGKKVGERLPERGEAKVVPVGVDEDSLTAKIERSVQVRTQETNTEINKIWDSVKAVKERLDGSGNPPPPPPPQTDCIYDGVRFTNSLSDHIVFNTPKSSTYDCDGDIGSYSFGGKAVVNGRKIKIISGNAAGSILTLSEDCSSLTGTLKLSDFMGLRKSVDLYKQRN